MKTKLMAVTAIIAALMGASFATVAENAGTQIKGLQLPVMINQTGTYVDAQTNMLVYPGDRVMAMSGGSVTVVYSNGCAQSVSDNEIVQVGTAESCSALVEAGTNFAVGAGAAAGASTAGAGVAGAGVAAVGTGAAVTGGVVAGVTLGGAVVVSDTVRNEESTADESPAGPLIPPNISAQ